MNLNAMNKYIKGHWLGFAVRLLIIAGFAFIIGFFKTYHLPKIKNWLLVEIETQSQLHSPFRIWPQSVEINFVPLGVQFNDVRILPQNEWAEKIGPIHLKNFQVDLSLFSLMQGQIRASEVILNSPEVNAIFKEDLAQLLDSNSNSSQSSFQLDDIYDLPIDELAINNLLLRAKFNGENLAVQLADANFSVENKYKSLLVKVDIPQLTMKQLGNRPDINMSLSTKTLVEDGAVHISSLQLKANKSFLIASGKLEGDTANFQLENAELKTRALLQLNEIVEIIPVFTSQLKVPQLSGTIGADSEINYNFKSRVISGNYNVETKNINVDNRLIGTVQSRGVFEQQTIQSPKISIENSTGAAEINNFSFSFDKTGLIKGDVVIHNVNMQPFLQKIGVGLLPVESQVSGSLSCDGELYPNTLVKCTNVAADAKNLHIYGDSRKDTIVKLRSFGAKGSMEITDQKVSYEAKATAGAKSRGSSKGSISYEKGFDISFVGERVEMSDIDDLIGLKLEGAAVLSGNTQGTADWGQVEIDLRGKQIWLEDYGLGSVDSIVRYKAGKLTFRKMKGQFNSSRYEGNVSIDINKKQIYMNQKLVYVDLLDLQKLFSRKTQLPVKINGTGSGQLKAWGPLEFSKMSYDLTSSFYRGEVAKETFDKAVFNVSAENGNVQAKKAVITKAESTITASGTINPEGIIDAVIVGRQLRLEQSENLSQLGLDIVGQFDSTLVLKGQLPDPEMILNGRLKNLVIGESPAEDSSFQLNIKNDRLIGDINFIGKTVQAKFTYPYSNNGPFDLDLKTTNWDFTNLFSILSKTAKKRDFVTTLTSEVQLSSTSGGFWNSSGAAKISSFGIQRGPLALESTAPISIQFKNGSMNSQDFYLRGKGTFLKLDLVNATADAFNAEINGKVDMSLLSLFTPFLDDLRGTLAVAVKTQGPIDNFTAAGSAFIENGYVKLSDFPHPFDQINADLLFNQKTIIINALKASLGGGPVKGEGRITVESMTDVPVDVRAQFTDVSLNLPEGMRTKGSGEIQFKGRRFPYLLKGVYNVNYGDITMDFGGSETQENEVKPSEFLPQFLTEDAFQPITMDLEININKPVAVQNELIDASATGNITVKGTTENMTLNGVITPQPGGKIKVKDTEFDVTSGYVDYRNAPPENPYIYVTGEAKVTETVLNSQTGREESTDYEVEMLVQGRAPDLNINLDSRPPLSYQQIVSLLALGMTTATTVDQSYDPQAKTDDDALASGVIGTQLGTRLLGQGLSEPLKERLGVELKISTSQSTTDNATYPKVIFSKQWTPKWETSASRTIENNPKSDVKFEYKLNDNISFIGLWEGREQTATGTDKEIEENKVGVDVEYKVNFK